VGSRPYKGEAAGRMRRRKKVEEGKEEEEG